MDIGQCGKTEKYQISSWIKWSTYIYCIIWKCEKVGLGVIWAPENFGGVGFVSFWDFTAIVICDKRILYVSWRSTIMLSTQKIPFKRFYCDGFLRHLLPPKITLHFVVLLDRYLTGYFNCYHIGPYHVHPFLSIINTNTFHKIS